MSLKQVAAKAGVSAWTVSQALRDNPRVALKTRLKIREIADELGYRPNAFAAGLRQMQNAASGHTTPNLACIYGDKKKDYRQIPEHNWNLTMNGCIAQAQAAGYHLECFWAYSPDHRERRLNDILYARGVEGVVLVGIHENEVDLQWPEYSCAYASSIGRLIKETRNFQYTSINFAETAQQAFDEIWQQGFRRIGLCIDTHHEQLIDYIDLGVEHAFHVKQKTPASKRIPAFELTADSPLSQQSESFVTWYQKYQPEVILGHQLAKLKSAITKTHPQIATKLIWVSLGPETGPGISGIEYPYSEMGAAAVNIVIQQLHRNHRGKLKAGEIGSLSLLPRWHPL